MAEEENDNSIYHVDIVGHTMIMGCYNIFQRMDEVSQSKYGGTSSRHTCKPRDRISAHDVIVRNYYAGRPVYPLSDFRNKSHEKVTVHEDNDKCRPT